jgi:hypothetical protein
VVLFGAQTFNKVVVTRFRIALENRGLAAGTINGRLAAVRRLAYEAADAGLLSPELAAGIRRVKGVKKLGVRLGNWLTAEEARRLWQAPDANTLKGNGTARFSQCCLVAGCESGNWLIWTSRICSSERSTGRLLIWLVKAGISGPYRCHAGSKRLSTIGSRQQNSKRASYSIASAGLANAGVRA